MMTQHALTRAPREPWATASMAFIALCITGISTRVSAQDQDERVYLKYHGQVANVPENVTQLSCRFLFTPLGQPNAPLYQETHPQLSLEGGRFSTTLGAQEEPLLAQYFREPLELNVSCDLDGDGEEELSVTEPVGQAPISARALSAAEADQVEASAVYADGRPLFGVDGAWLGAPIIPEYQGVPLIDGDGRWVGRVSAPSGNVEELSAGQLLADSLYVTELRSDSSQTVSLHLRSLYLSPGDESSDPSLLIDEQGQWRGGLNASSGVIGQLQALSLITASLSTERGVTLIDADGYWVGPLPDGDRDADGFPDLQELALGTDPLLSDDRPLDQDENGTPDVLEPRTSLGDTLFTEHNVTVSASTQVTLPQPNEGAWLLAQVNFNVPESARLESLEVLLDLSYLDGSGEPTSFAPLKVTLMHAEGLELTLHDQNETLAGQYPEADRPAELWPVAGTPLNGAWRLYVEDSGADPSLITLNDLTLNATYQVEGEARVTQSLNLGGTQRVLALPAPTDATEAATKGYVDELLSYPSRLTYRHKSFTPLQLGTEDALEQAFSEEVTRGIQGGLSSSEWNSITTPPLASDLNPASLDALLTEQAQAGSSALLVSESLYGIEGLFPIFVAQIEVENLTASPINWPLVVSTSCAATRPSSLSLNGVTQWKTVSTPEQNTPCETGYRADPITLELPPAQVSSVLIISRANNSFRLFAALLKGSATLPEGLRYRARWRN